MLLERLKEETRSQHHYLESLIGLPLSSEQHEWNLRGFYGFVAPWELQILSSSYASYLMARIKTMSLMDDLQSLGLTMTDIRQLPQCSDLPSLGSISEILGSMYVIEGSTLGGQMISHHLETTLGFRDGNGYTYYRSYGPDIGLRWKAFRETLLRHSSPENDDAMVTSARLTFERLGQWFEHQRATAVA